MDADYKIIKNLLIDYAVALDARNWKSLDKIFHENAVATYGSEDIGILIKSSSRNEIIDMCKQNLNGCGPTQHLLANFRITTTPNSINANSSCYVRVLHIGISPNDNESYEMFGEYQDEWQKFNDQWMIVKRRLRVDFELGNRDKVLSPGI
ncbi:nuclear transport factor 2 family protein [Gammaproteobacteria bacterium]|nr:nuclear transport factor 2 family protein [Gammaproteobacteria bacterium]